MPLKYSIVEELSSNNPSRLLFPGFYNDLNKDYLNTSATIDLSNLSPVELVSSNLQNIKEIDSFLPSQILPPRLPEIPQYVDIDFSQENIRIPRYTPPGEPEVKPPLTYQAKKSSYVPYFQPSKPNTSGKAPGYTPRFKSPKTNFVSDERTRPVRYISKQSVEDPFDQSFGFIPPSYTPKSKRTQGRVEFTFSPSYTPKNKKPKETTQSKQSPAYLSKEYLKKASRY